MSRRKIVGRRVAVAYDRQSNVGQPSGLPVRDEPDAAAPVVARVAALWLEDAVFVVGRRTCFVVGDVLPPRPERVTAKTGWYEVRLDRIEQGCFYVPSSGASVRTAKYAHLEPRRIEAFGIEKGPAVHSEQEAVDRMPQRPTLGPARGTWRGEMGGLNYDLPTKGATVDAISSVLATHPGAVIVDGADDWHAPDYVRPEVLVRRAGIVPVAWWHTGLSGVKRSGVVLSSAQYEALCNAFRVDYGCELEAIPGLHEPSFEREPCGCWKGEGVRIFR